MAPVDDMMLAVMHGREAEARALIQSTRRDALALGQGVHVQLARLDAGGAVQQSRAL